MKIYTCCLLLTALSFCKSNHSYAQKTQVKAYSLFRPVAKEQMRDMETDRPDFTESPITVDAGHLQYETDLFRREKERGETVDQRTIYLNKANLNVGLTHSTAIQIGFENFVLLREKDLQTGELSRKHGIGDMNIRIKQNLLGNDGGNFAIAVLPYIKFPTARYTSDSKYEGGIIVPMHYKLPGEWKLGTQLEGDRLQDMEGGKMHTEIMQSLTVSHEILKHVDCIAETYYSYNTKEHHWSNYLNAAAQVGISDNFKFDLGFNYGLQHDAEKNYFIGTAFRF
jgi:hypothetical protein